DERVDPGVACGVDHPVDEPTPEQGMEVLGHGGAHPSSEPGGHNDCCWLRGRQRMNGWGARIRTWDRGTKTRCLTTWLRPIGASILFRTLVVLALGEEVDERDDGDDRDRDDGGRLRQEPHDRDEHARRLS